MRSSLRLAQHDRLSSLLVSVNPTSSESQEVPSPEDMPIHGAHVQERPGTAVREFLATTLAIGHHLDLRQSSFRANSIGDAQQELPSFILSLRVSSRVSCVIRLTSSLAVTQEPDQLFGCHDPLPHRPSTLVA
ncbi:hypothetical protein FOXYSP1_20833 [Fusarium oxysporum f. sp. phaseoli]